MHNYTVTVRERVIRAGECPLFYDRMTWSFRGVPPLNFLGMCKKTPFVISIRIKLMTLA